MTATLNGSGALDSASLPTGTDIVHRSTGETVKFVRWTGMPGECADVQIDDGMSHVCNVSTEYRLADPMPRPDDPQEATIASLQIELEQAQGAMQRANSEAAEAERRRDAAIAERNDATAAAMRTQEDLDQRITDLVREKTTAEAKLQEFWEALEQEADNRGWCTEYDEFAERFGYHARHANIETRCSVEVTTELDGDDLIQAAGARYFGTASTDESLTFIWSFDMDPVYTRVRRDACACAETDWEHRVRRQLGDNGVKFEDFDVTTSCENCS